MKNTIIANDLRNYVVNKYPNNSGKRGGTMPSMKDTVSLMNGKSLPAKFPFKFNLNSFIIVLLVTCLFLVSCTPRYITIEQAANGKAHCGQGLR
jgi:hypothetical protein